MDSCFAKAVVQSIRLDWTELLLIKMKLLSVEC